MEAQLLHIECRPGEQWRVVGRIPLAKAHIDLGLTNLGGLTYSEGVLECLAHTLSEGGACFGWYVIVPHGVSYDNGRLFTNETIRQATPYSRPLEQTR